MRRGIIAFILTLPAVTAQAPSPFVQLPYLQLGDSTQLAAKESVTVMWHATDSDQKWALDYRQKGAGKWNTAPASLLRRVDVRTVPAHRVYQAVAASLKPGAEFEYRVTLGGKPVFEAVGRARRPAGQPHSFAVLGDMAQATPGQKSVAYQIHKADPDYFTQVGDVVYGRGLVSEYYSKYFPIYNCDQPAPDVCGATLRRAITLALPGNHDMQPKMDFGANPDALGLFYYYSLPLNGPFTAREGESLPVLSGTPEQLAAFYKNAPNYPRMAMYSVDYGGAHWTMLDSNTYTDWTLPALREWVRKDLRAAKKADWRFIGVHHPPFNSSKAHFNDQWIRLLSDIFEDEGVDIVFSGHVHNYQRSFPMKFKVKPEHAAARPMIRGKIDGEWTLDKEFDGKTKTKPNGVLWIVTGAGGAGLYNPEQESDRASWQEFTARFVSTIHSFTMVDLERKKLTLRQIDKDGVELDRISITR
jgi:hypothetical protein